MPTLVMTKQNDNVLLNLKRHLGELLGNCPFHGVR